MTSAATNEIPEETTTPLDLDSIDDRLISLSREIETIATHVVEIHGFATRLAATLDGLAQNPMVAAMLPPELFQG